MWHGTWKSHGTHVNESCPFHPKFMSRICVCHGTLKNESWRTYTLVMWMSHVTHPLVIWMSHVTCELTYASRRERNESLNVQFDMEHQRMSHGTHMNESWLFQFRVMAHIWMSHGTHTNELSLTCEAQMNESWHKHKSVMSHTWMSHDTQTNGSCHTHQ